MKQFIVISGIDGCGKTTIIEQLRKKLEKQGFRTHYEWMRYNHRLVKPIHGLCRLIGLSRRYEIDGKNIWRHEFYRNKLFSSFYIALTWLDVWLGRILLDARLLFKNADIVICDRWIQDIIIDLIVDTRQYSLLYKKWCPRFNRVLPVFSKQYLIIRNAKNIISARPDVNLDLSFKSRHKLYKRLMNNSDVTVINNDKTIEAAIDSILNKWIDAYPMNSIGQPDHIKSKI